MSVFSAIAKKALELPANQRLALANVLLDSLNEHSGMEKPLLGELSKRARDLRRGKVKGLTTEQAYGFSL